MATSPDDALKLAKQLAEEAREEDEARVAAVKAATAYPVAPADSSDLKIPVFLHERELADALRLVTLLASGRNPFQPEELDRLSASQQLDVLRALSVIACTLVSTHEHSSKPAVEPFIDDTDPAAKRPLEQYLRRVEKQAILEALEEARYNHSEAARILGITYRALRYKIESLGIEVLTLTQDLVPI